MALTGTVVVPDGIYGETVEATITTAGTPPKNSTPLYVRALVFTDGALVWGKFFPVEENAAQIGPFKATTWQEGPADGKAELGYFTRNGLGKWIILDTDEFSVSAP